MHITMSGSTLQVTITMFNNGYAPVVDENKYPGMGYIVVDQNTWSVGFALWQQSVLNQRHSQWVYGGGYGPA